ncbi:PTS sugar transporter subunit IIA [Pantoea sp. FN0302]|uniref:PTS sugar transporter subunit IIA n=1 Tax=unclassified Pantoea TaxID=2630326 RepID=UPI003CFB00F5
MKRHYIFASHGSFAAGIRQSVELILGEQPHLHALCAYVDENDDLTRQVDSLMAAFTPQDELIVITDIFAGSVNNEFIRYLHRPDFHLLAGLNLPLVIEMLIASPDEPAIALINEALSNARAGMQYCNHTISSASCVDKDF